MRIRPTRIRGALVGALLASIVACVRVAPSAPPPSVAPATESRAPEALSPAPPTSTPVPTVRVVLHVRTWADEPIAGAIVDATGPDAAARATTDAAGDAVFDGLAPGAWMMVASAPGFASDATQADIGPLVPSPWTLHLEPAQRLAGRVLEDDGSPIAGASVMLGTSEKWDSFPSLRTVTNADGAFTIDGVRSGRPALLAARPGECAFRVAIVSVPEVKRIDVRLPRRTELRGVVLDVENGLPVEGALVRAASASWYGRFETSATSDVVGLYAIRSSMPASVILGVTKPGFVDVERNERGGARAVFVASRDGDVFVHDFRMRRREDGDAPDDTGPRNVRGDIAVARAATDPPSALHVRGRVRGFDGGAPPPGTRVSVGWTEHPEARGSVDTYSSAPVASDGLFEVSVSTAAKHFFIRAESPELTPKFWQGERPGPRPWDTAWIPTVEGQTDYAVDVVIGPGVALAGRVVAKDTGQAIQGAWIFCRFNGILGSPLAPVRATTDADGAFRVEHLDRRQFGIMVEAAGFIPHGFWIDAGAPTSTIALERAIGLGGFVRFADGRPAEGVEVVASAGGASSIDHYPGNEWGRSRVDAVGRFRIRVPPGPVALDFTPPDKSGFDLRPRRVENVVVGAKDVEIVVEKVAPAPRVREVVTREPNCIKGRAFGAGGEPLAGAVIEFHPVFGTRSAETTTDPDGRFSSGWIPADSYEIRVRPKRPDGTPGEPVRCATASTGDAGVDLRVGR